MIGDELRTRTRRFALDVIALCAHLGHDDLGRLIRPQLLRAGTGVAANHRAAGHSRSRREFVARLSVVIEETDETELWLDFLETLGYGPLELVRRLRTEAVQLRAIFSASRATAAAKLQKRRSAGGGALATR
jgi:four helix bundle protein